MVFVFILSKELLTGYRIRLNDSTLKHDLLVPAA